MKRVFSILLAGLLIASCNNEVAKEPAVKEAEGHHHHDEDHGLSLNDGKKWNSDESTNTNVQALQSAMEQFSSVQSPEMEDYKFLAANLQSAIDKLVKECRMEGKDHDMLHAWLEPLMKQVRELEASTETSGASAKTKEISAQLGLYPQYFE